MLAAFVSLRVFTLELTGSRSHRSEKYLRYITKVSHHAPHLDSFNINRGGNSFRFKRVNANWAVCDEAEYPAP